MDVSKHRWFGPERPFATLVGAIDDATSKVTGGTFRAEEDGRVHRANCNASRRQARGAHP